MQSAHRCKLSKRDASMKTAAETATQAVERKISGAREKTSGRSDDAGGMCRDRRGDRQRGGEGRRVG